MWKMTACIVPHAEIPHRLVVPLTAEEVARPVHRARRADVESRLDTLTALGPVEHPDKGAYAG